MANTIRPYTGDGTTVLYNIDFDLGYIRRAHIYVYLAGNIYTNEIAYTYINDTQIQINTPVANDVVFNIRRVVPRNSVVNNYEDGAALHEDNLDDSFKQAVMILEEIQDGYIDPEGVFSVLANLDMNGFSILNLPFPSTQESPLRKKDVVDAGEGPSFTYVDEKFTEAGESINSHGAIPDGVFNSGTALFNACATGNTVVIPKTPLPYVFELLESQVDTVLGSLQFIRAEQKIIIQLPEMDSTRTESYTPASPYGENINVKGAATSFQSATGVTTDSEATRDHLITITGMSDTSKFTVGGFAFVKSVVPTSDGNKVIEGMWEVTAVAATTVQLNITAFKSTLPTFTLTACSIAPALTILRVHGAVGIDMFNAGHGGVWQSIALVGNNTGGNEAHGVRNYNCTIRLANSTAEPFGVNGFAGHHVYTLENGTTIAFDSYSSNAGRHGYYELDGGNLIGTRIISTGNGLAGHVSSTNSQSACSQSNTSGNLQRGHLSSNKAIVTCASHFSYENGDAGIRCDNGARMNADGASIAGSVSYGARASGGTIVGTINYDYGNGAADEFTEDNGTINAVSKRYHQVGAGSGATASGLANGIVTDSDAVNGITILNKENQYGYVYLGNEVDNAEAGFRYRGSSNALDFISNGALVMSINSSGNLTPFVDNDMDVGSASKRFRVIYAADGTINTSDERTKTKLLSINDRERACALEVKKCIGKFQFLDAVNSKGDDARIHFGVGAQTVRDIFESHELKADDYALFCYDEWEREENVVPAVLDKEGKVVVESTVEVTEAGNIYGIRYCELSMFILAAM